MEVRTRKEVDVKKLTTEEELLDFCGKQIAKMKKHLRLNTEDGFPSFFEINQALMGYQNVNLALMTVYYTTKHEYAEKKTEYDNWYAGRYTEIRNNANPISLSAQKWISTKEIEFMVRMKYTGEMTEKTSELNLINEKLSFMRRMLDSWKGHQFVLTQLSKNVMGEMQGKEF